MYRYQSAQLEMIAVAVIMTLLLGIHTCNPRLAAFLKDVRIIRNGPSRSNSPLDKFQCEI